MIFIGRQGVPIAEIAIASSPLQNHAVISLSHEIYPIRSSNPTQRSIQRPRERIIICEALASLDGKRHDMHKAIACFLGNHILPCRDFGHLDMVDNQERSNHYEKEYCGIQHEFGCYLTSFLIHQDQPSLQLLHDDLILPR